MGPHHMAGCFGCQVHCRAQYKIPTGPYAGKYDEGPEYTSQGAFGGEPDCKKRRDTVLTGNHLVNQYGVDNLEIGSMISWAMELYELGILTNKETDGLDLRFGNDEALIEMIHRICHRKGWLGDVLADGGIPAAEKIGKNSFDYLDPGQRNEQSPLRRARHARPGLEYRHRLPRLRSSEKPAGHRSVSSARKRCCGRFTAARFPTTDL